MKECTRCGHYRGRHEHYRSGTDCGNCPCRKYTHKPRWMLDIWEAIRVR